MTSSSLGSVPLWIGFLVFILAMLALDLGVFHRHAHRVRAREAAIWTGVWVGLSLLFNAGIYWRFGAQPALEFLTGYLIEKSLSVDNIFVFVLIFSSLRVPALHQHRVLFWGVLTALVLRALMIWAGAAMLARFHWVIYVFGAFLIATGVKLFTQRDREEHPERSLPMRLAMRWIPSTAEYHEHHFFVRQAGRWLATPLFMALLLIEVTDVIFAVDSIPAIFGVTADPFIVFTSNIFAILGLRSLFFLLSGVIEKFTYLKLGLAAVLVFVGGKMVTSKWIVIEPWVSLIVVLTLLGIALVASWLRARVTGNPASHPSEPA